MKDMTKKEMWTSRKLWFFIASLAIGCGAAIMGHLNYELVTLLCGLPSVYGIVNVRAKKVAQVDYDDAE